MVFGGKQRAVEALVATYVERARECVQRFVEGMDLWLTRGEAMSNTLSRAHEAESQADDVRRELCLLPYGKALFPESRGDILGLVEAVDKVPNRAEAIIRRLKSEHICAPAPALADASERETQCRFQKGRCGFARTAPSSRYRSGRLGSSVPGVKTAFGKAHSAKCVDECLARNCRARAREYGDTSCGAGCDGF